MAEVRPATSYTPQIQCDFLSPLYACRKARVRQAFLHFDKEHRGYVTYDQTTEILRNLLGFPEAKCRTVTETYDKNKDGKIDYKEFIEFYSMLEEE